MEQVGLEPNPPDCKSSALANYATSPITTDNTTLAVVPTPPYDVDSIFAVRNVYVTCIT